MRPVLSSAVVAASLILALSGADAQDKPVAQPLAARPTVQQLFEGAGSAMLAGDHADALDKLTQLEARVASNPRSLAIVRVRKGRALGELHRRDEARDYLERGLAGLPADDATLAPDRYMAADRLALMRMTDLDYAGASQFYARALAEAGTAGDRIHSYLGRAQAELFVDPAVALELADAAQALVAADPTITKADQAPIAMVKGRALLNLGRFAEAEKMLAAAIKAQGGLTLKVGYADLVSRSDASIAALLAGHDDSARSYLIYTGAGRMTKQDFTSGANMPLPVCGVDGVTPDDRAVVEFGIEEDGTVGYARPIYGSRPGDLALVFARAVSTWSWMAEDVRNIPPLFRLVTRLELRCSNENGSGPSIQRIASQALGQWLTTVGTPALPDMDDGKPDNRPTQIARIERMRTAHADAPAMEMVAMLELIANPASTRDDLTQFGPPVTAIADRLRTPPLARLRIDTILRDAERRTGRGKPAKTYALMESRYAADTDASALYRLVSYDNLSPREKPAQAVLLDQVIDNAALAQDDPLKVAARMRRASLRAAAKDMAGAHADFEKTGLDAAQCSIVDAAPALRYANTSAADYPTDMVSAGVEGWTRVQYDVGADGRTISPRAVITYPPMTFAQNGERIMARARYEQSYRPAGTAGCTASTSTINFVNPRGS